MTTIYIVTKTYNDYEGSYSTNVRAFSDKTEADLFSISLTDKQSARLKIVKWLETEAQDWFAKHPRPRLDSPPLSKKELGKISREKKAIIIASEEKQRKRSAEWHTKLKEYNEQYRVYTRMKIIEANIDADTLKEFDSCGFLSREEFSFDVEPIELD